MMEQAREKGVTNRGAASIAPTVVKSGKNEFELLDCVDGSKWVQVKPSSSPDGVAGAHYHTEATVAFKSGKWMVSELYWGEAGSCMD
ncbi:hypothetical protein AB0Q95_40520 [Streptomyces sp. NPDC059900]|uniref:hypothetical protein n=1 Tax=Streptomyces sp. NPDC059900 TaxID=3155816 RepID=UPI00342D81B5